MPDVIERAREAVAAELDRLRRAYGSFPVEETRVENDPDYFEHGLDIVRERGYLADAGAWVLDDAGRALFIRHPDAPDTWGVPGGLRAADESMDATARRETREETGIDPEITGVWKARRKQIVHASADRRYPMLTVWFEGRGSGTPTADGDEVLEARWFPPDRPPAVFDFLEPKVATWAEA